MQERIEPTFDLDDLPEPDDLTGPENGRRQTGGSESKSYYEVSVELPTNPAWSPYNAACNDIIEVLEMSFAEGEAFKAIWRRAAERQGRRKPGVTDSQRYNAEKVRFFGDRMVLVGRSGRRV